MGKKGRAKVRKKANSLLERVHIFRIGIRVQVFEPLEKRKEAGAGLLLTGLVVGVVDFIWQIISGKSLNSSEYDESRRFYSMPSRYQGSIMACSPAGQQYCPNMFAGFNSCLILVYNLTRLIHNRQNSLCVVHY